MQWILLALILLLYVVVAVFFWIHLKMVGVIDSRFSDVEDDNARIIEYIQTP